MGFHKHFHHDEMMIDNDPEDVCQFCGFIRPCECDERTVNERYPWPADLSSLTITQAAELCADRGRMRMAIQGGAV